MNNSALQQIIKAFNKFTPQQKMVTGGALLLSTIIFIVIFVVLNGPNYITLYSNLSETDASIVINYLNTQKISYELANNGTTVKVPKNKLYEVRFSLAGKGVLNSGVTGYEIFDESTMGMSEFLQKLNYKRALEGELVRTIVQQEGIEGARVLIVLPKRTVFKEEEEPPKASVVVKLSNGTTFSNSNTTAILNLVANSVEGLSPQNVILLDTKGRLLSKKIDDEQEGAINSKQYEIKQSVEQYLSKKVKSILNQVIGYGNSTVQVNAEFNFNQIEKTMETFDPESQVAISEQTVKNENIGTTLSDSTSESSQTRTTNYEINKTVQKVIEGTGNIVKLSVAVVINDIEKQVTKGEQTETVYEPRSPEQIKKLETIIKNAIGINIDRGDQISLVNIPFETKDIGNLDFVEPLGTFDLNKIYDLILILIAIIASFFLLKGIMGKLKNEKPLIAIQSSEDQPTPTVVKPQITAFENNIQNNLNFKRNREFIVEGDLEDEITDEAMRKKSQQDKISSYVSKNPEDAARLINSWLHQDEFQE